MSPAAVTACLLIRCYQMTLGRLLGTLGPGICRFTPTCSQYTLEAIRRHGFLKGSLLGAWRVLRCNPFCRGGDDPVP
jgi:putative membrane protein insertion efficiency factor